MRGVHAHHDSSRGDGYDAAFARKQREQRRTNARSVTHGTAAAARARADRSPRSICAAARAGAGQYGARSRARRLWSAAARDAARRCAAPAVWRTDPAAAAVRPADDDAAAPDVLSTTA